MARGVFKSKVDRWIWIVMIGAVLGTVAAMGAVVVEGAQPVAVILVVFACLLAIALLASVMFGTYYTVDRGVLIIRSGPFRWKVGLEEISSVEATRSPLSSPALSMDRIRIRYRKRRSIIVSPADKEGFLRAIGHDLIR